MTEEVVISPNEIYLSTTRFPIKGGVRPSLISVLPGKVTIGSYTLADELVASSWGINDQRGGILVEEMDEAVHQDRCWWSTLNLGFRGHLVLPPLATDCGSGGLSSKDAHILADYNNEIYACFDTRFRKWNETNGNFNDEISSQIEDCEDVWDAFPYQLQIHACDVVWDELVDPDVTASVDTANQKEGSGCLKLDVATACDAGDILATDSIASKNLSNYTKIVAWIKSTVDLASGNLQVLLDDTLLCASPIESLNIPTVTANTWTRVSINLADPSLCTAIISVGIKMVVDKGAFTVRIDNIRAQVDDIDVEKAVTTIVDNEDLTQATPITCTLAIQPHKAGQVKLAITDSNASITAFSIVVAGTDASGSSIDETFIFTGGLIQTGSEEFTTITSIEVTSISGAGAGDTLAVTRGNTVRITINSTTAGEMVAIETVSPGDLTEWTNLKLWIKSQLAASAGDLQFYFYMPTSWMSPTSDGGGWNNPERAWDDDITTYAVTGVSASSWGVYLELNHSAILCDKIKFRAGSVTADIDKIDVDVYDGSAWHDVYEGAFTFDTWTEKTIPGGLTLVTKMRVRFHNNHATSSKEAKLFEVDFKGAGTEVVDLPILTTDTWTEITEAITAPANLADVIAVGLKSVTDLGAEPYAITIDDVRVNAIDLVSNPTDATIYKEKLYVACTTDYYIRNGPVLTKDADNAVFFVEWDVYLCKVDSTGQFAYSTNGTSWTNKGKLNLPDNSVTSLFVYRDADGNPQVYAGTKKGLYVHDFTGGKWIQTELTLPNHPTCGKGTVKWRDAAFVSAGLDVLKYIAARTATITSAGLSRDDGLPSPYRGEITKLIGAYNDFYALVDSSLVSGAGYSSVMAFDGMGWQCKWLSGMANKPIKCGLVSSTHAYYLWFGADNKVYRIPLQRDIRNPKQLSTYAYAESGIHITPWFDANWIGEKLALAIKIFCKDTTADEKVQVSYRIDHSSTNIGSVGAEWTSLGTIVAAGDGVETEYILETNTGEDDGVVFKSIQFRFDLARATENTNPEYNSPDIQYIKLKYLKLLDAKWGWTVTVDCSQEYKGNTSAQLDAALKTIVETQTLVDFTFRNETSGSYTYKVRVANASGLERTAEDWRAEYAISLVEP